MLMPSIFGENLFDDFFTPFYYDDKDEKKAEKKLYGHRAQNLLRTDIKETKEGYELVIDVPGFKKDEVKVALKDGYLTFNSAVTSSFLNPGRSISSSYPSFISLISVFIRLFA